MTLIEWFNSDDYQKAKEEYEANMKKLKALIEEAEIKLFILDLTERIAKIVISNRRY